MNSDLDGLHAQLTKVITGCAYEVHKELGHGFLEKVYATALRNELVGRGMAVVAEAPTEVLYKGQTVGLYFADLLVDRRVICEIKAVRSLLPEHEAQLLHYLKTTAIEVGLLLNFGTDRVQIKRMVFQAK